ncbi:Uncharacterised protein [Salmonella enterica subsp. enterica serovar Typhimurium str. DT104]|nr:Uncharacterised protein [Salmonella enterica subsp. enterica serovar Typhimurium str. DT104]
MIPGEEIALFRFAAGKALRQRLVVAFVQFVIAFFAQQAGNIGDMPLSLPVIEGIFVVAHLKHSVEQTIILFHKASFKSARKF